MGVVQKKFSRQRKHQLSAEEKLDTDLYKLYNTNIHERIAEMKAKEARELSEKTD